MSRKKPDRTAYRRPPFCISMDRDVRERVKAYADEERLPLSRCIERLIVRALDQREAATNE